MVAGGTWLDKLVTGSAIRWCSTQPPPGYPGSGWSLSELGEEQGRNRGKLLALLAACRGSEEWLSRGEQIQFAEGFVFHELRRLLDHTAEFRKLATNAVLSRVIPLVIPG